ncbi:MULTISPECIES: sugar kinase [Sphingomonas]|uniref:sugar kinase n=1 Tax=Sphingomonas TaxID=13687 RepID=UPI001F078CE4|nr:MULTISPECIES: sugar kinase [Sphingomonas]
MSRIVIVGEGMLELARAPSGGGWQLGHGGDTLNTAIHLARLGRPVAFMTALGKDRFSDELRAAWQAEGVDTALIATDPARAPGLYAIANDPDGERHFTYWRGDSAARHLFALPHTDALVAQAAQADLLLFSMISLAILPEVGRHRLFALAQQVRERGGRVAFDTNYRPRLWPDLATAQGARRLGMAVADIGLPTREDEAALAGTADLAAIAAEWREAGVAEVVIKCGGEGCLIDGNLVPPPALLQPRDTSGAGDAFNAGYLHARLAGQAPRDGAAAGHRLAGWVVMHQGAVPPRTDDAPYAALAQLV